MTFLVLIMWIFSPNHVTQGEELYNPLLLLSPSTLWGLSGPMISPCNNTALSHRMLICNNVIVFSVPWHLDPLRKLITAYTTVYCEHMRVVSFTWGLPLSLRRIVVVVVLLDVAMFILEHSFVTISKCAGVKHDKRGVSAEKENTEIDRVVGKCRQWFWLYIYGTNLPYTIKLSFKKTFKIIKQIHRHSSWSLNVSALAVPQIWISKSFL